MTSIIEGKDRGLGHTEFLALGLHDIEGKRCELFYVDFLFLDPYRVLLLCEELSLFFSVINHPVIFLHWLIPSVNLTLDK